MDETGRRCVGPPRAVRFHSRSGRMDAPDLGGFAVMGAEGAAGGGGVVLCIFLDWRPLSNIRVALILMGLSVSNLTCAVEANPSSPNAVAVAAGKAPRTERNNQGE